MISVDGDNCVCCNSLLKQHTEKPGGQADTQIDRETNRQIETDRQTEQKDGQTDKHLDRRKPDNVPMLSTTVPLCVSDARTPESASPKKNRQPSFRQRCTNRCNQRQGRNKRTSTTTTHPTAFSAHTHQHHHRHHYHHCMTARTLLSFITSTAAAPPPTTTTMSNAATTTIPPPPLPPLHEGTHLAVIHRWDVGVRTGGEQCGDHLSGTARSAKTSKDTHSHTHNTTQHNTHMQRLRW
jgi:hypothetical protein